MTQSNDRKISNNRYPNEFLENALVLAQRIGIAKAASELNLHESQLYAWRKNSSWHYSAQNVSSSNLLKLLSLNVNWLRPIPTRNATVSG